MKTRNGFRQNCDRVRYGPAENTRVKVLHRTRDLYLIVIQAAKAVRDRGNTGPKHARVGEDQRICFQPMPIFSHEIPQIPAPGPFLTFDKYLYIDGQTTFGFLQRFESLQVKVHLPFVIGTTATVKMAAPNGRFERRKGPQPERFRRLHVIVPVEKDGRSAKELG